MRTDRIWNQLTRTHSGETLPEASGELHYLYKKNPDTHLKIQSLKSLNANKQLTGGQEKIYYNSIYKLKEHGQMPLSEEFDYSYDDGNNHRKNFSFRQLILAIKSIVLTSLEIFARIINKKNFSTSALALNTNKSVSAKHNSQTKFQTSDYSVVCFNAWNTLACSGVKKYSLFTLKRLLLMLYNSC